MPLSVSEPAPCVVIDVVPVKVMLPLAVAAVALLLSSAPTPVPVPARDSVFDKVLPFKSSAPPLVTVIVPVPNGPVAGGPVMLPLPDLSVPELTWLLPL